LPENDAETAASEKVRENRCITKGSDKPVLFDQLLHAAAAKNPYLERAWRSVTGFACRVKAFIRELLEYI
jgi:hypothetical protein